MSLENSSPETSTSSAQSSKRPVATIREGPVAPLRDPDGPGPPRSPSGSVGLTATGSIAASISRVGQRPRGHLDAACAAPRSGAVRQHRHPGHRALPQSAGAVSVIRNATLQSFRCPERRGRPVHTDPRRWHRIDPGGWPARPRGRTSPGLLSAVYRDLHQHRDRPTPATLPTVPGTTGILRLRADSTSRRTRSSIDNLRQHTWLTTAGTFTLLFALRLCVFIAAPLAMAVSDKAGSEGRPWPSLVAFGRWRRTRPFWGGFLLLLAGIELLLISR